MPVRSASEANPGGGDPRLLLVIRWPVGGIRTHIKYVYLDERFKRYHLTVLMPDHPQSRILAQQIREFHPSAEIHLVKNELPALFCAVWRRLFSEHFALVHSHGLTSGALACLPAWLRRLPHVMTLHDVFLKEQFRGLRGHLRLLAVNAVAVLFDRIVAVSSDARVNFLKFVRTVDAAKVVVIQNGIVPERFARAAAVDLRENLQLPAESFLIGFLGRFMNQKGFRYLVDAMALLVERNTDFAAKAVVISFGWGAFIREEQKGIDSRGLSRWFQFVPFEENVAGVLKALDVVAMPSLWEACPLLPMECLCVGVPLIATDCIGLREVVADTPAITVPMRNAPALAQALESLFLDKNRRSFQDYTHHALDRFDVNGTRMKVASVYGDLLRREVASIPAN